MPLIPRSSYYDKQYRPAAALHRARRPFLVRNALTGISIFGFAIGVYVFTINAVSQDDFEDVKPPPLPTTATQNPPLKDSR